MSADFLANSFHIMTVALLILNQKFFSKGDGRDSFYRIILEEIAFFLQNIDILNMHWLQFFAANLFEFMSLFDLSTGLG